jgi:hypothetical protein
VEEEECVMAGSLSHVRHVQPPGIPASLGDEISQQDLPEQRTIGVARVMFGYVGLGMYALGPTKGRVN